MKKYFTKFIDFLCAWVILICIAICFPFMCLFNGYEIVWGDGE